MLSPESLEALKEAPWGPIGAFIGTLATIAGGIWGFVSTRHKRDIEVEEGNLKILRDVIQDLRGQITWQKAHLEELQARIDEQDSTIRTLRRQIDRCMSHHPQDINGSPG